MSALDATQVLAIGILVGSDDDPLRSGCNFVENLVRTLDCANDATNVNSKCYSVRY